MAFRQGQEAAALIRFSLSTEKWTQGTYECEAAIGTASDGSLLSGHKVRTGDGVLRCASKCLPLEEALDLLEEKSLQNS